jgi:hypothetical protein
MFRISTIYSMNSFFFWNSLTTNNWFKKLVSLFRFKRFNLNIVSSPVNICLFVFSNFRSIFQSMFTPGLKICTRLVSLFFYWIVFASRYQLEMVRCSFFLHDYEAICYAIDRSCSITSKFAPLKYAVIITI